MSSDERYPDGWPLEEVTQETLNAFHEDFCDLCAKHKLLAGATLMTEMQAFEEGKGGQVRLYFLGEDKVVRLLKKQFGLPWEDGLEPENKPRPGST